MFCFTQIRMRCLCFFRHLITLDMYLYMYLNTCKHSVLQKPNNKPGPWRWQDHHFDPISPTSYGTHFWRGCSLFIMYFNCETKSLVLLLDVLLSMSLCAQCKPWSSFSQRRASYMTCVKCYANRFSAQKW